MKAKLCSLFFLAFLFINTGAQTGNPYIYNYNLEGKVSEIWSLVQDDRGVMILAGSHGLELFDGQRTDQVKLAAIPYVLCGDNDRGITYVGTSTGFGYIQRNARLQYEFHPLNKGRNYPTTSIVANESHVFFISETKIVAISAGTKSIAREIAFKNMITGAFTHGKEVYVNVDNEGLYEISQLTPRTNAANSNFKTCDIIFGLNTRNQKTIIGTTQNKLYIFDSRSTKELKLKDSLFLQNNVLTGAVMCDDNTIITSTLLGGIAVIDINTGTIKQTIGYLDGLPDDEIRSVAIDASKGIWLSHAKGLSRVDLSLPVRNWSAFQGLQGNLLSVCVKNDSLFIGTSEGVFLLDKQNSFKEKVVTRNVKTMKNVTVNIPVETRRKGLFFFKKKEEMKEVQQQVEEIKAIKKKIRTLASVNYAFVKIAGINDKCKQMVESNGVLYVAGNNAVYAIAGKKASTVLAGHYVHFICPAKGAQLLCAANDGLFVVKRTGSSHATFEQKWSKGSKVNAVFVDKTGKVWLTLENKIVKATVNGSNITEEKEYTTADDFHSEIYVGEKNGQVTFFSDGSEYVYKNSGDVVEKTGDATYSDLCLQPGNISVKAGGLWQTWRNGVEQTSTAARLMNLFPDAEDVYFDSKSNIWVIENASIYQIENKNIPPAPFTIFVKSVTNKKGEFFILDSLNLPSEKNSLQISAVAPNYFGNGGVMYSYHMDGYSYGWSDWSSTPQFELNVIPPGNYTLNLKARDILGNETTSSVVKIAVEKPFTQTIFFYIIIVAAISIFFMAFTRLRTRKLEKDKQVLEQKVKERTRTIEEQKEEIEAQRDTLAKVNEEILQHKEEIEAQRDEIEAQRDQIQEQNVEIMHSITYAQRIQNAVMPKGDFLQGFFQDSFNLFMPRDIVSGDFYWTAQSGDMIVAAAADCTGHGIPGAFMSMLGVSLLNEIVMRNNIVEPAEILNQLRTSIIDTLSESDKYGHAKDGMDICLCVFDFNIRKVHFAGANNPLVIVRDGSIIEMEANRMPVGRHDLNDTPFKSTSIEMESNDTYYMFSDGYEDQFGGPSGKKFKKKQLREVFLEINQLPMKAQKEKLSAIFNNWKGSLDQVDDILVLGLKVK